VKQHKQQQLEAKPQSLILSLTLLFDPLATPDFQLLLPDLIMLLQHKAHGIPKDLKNTYLR
jgi:hypothetical protein